MNKIIGNQLWALLHTFAENYPTESGARDRQLATRFFQGFSIILTGTGCTCMLDWQLIIIHTPPALKSRDELVHWGHVVHDFINHKLGKPLYSKDSATDPIFLHLMQKIPQRKLELGSAAGCLKGCG